MRSPAAFLLVVLALFEGVLGYVNSQRGLRGALFGGSSLHHLGAARQKQLHVKMAASAVGEELFDDGYERRVGEFRGKLGVLKRDVMNVVTRVVVPFTLQLLFAVALSQVGALPAFAKGKGKRRRGGGGRVAARAKSSTKLGAAAAATAAEVATEALEGAASEAAEAAVGAVAAPTSSGATTKKYSKVIKRLLEGANADGSNFNMKAGDTRTEIAALLNSFSSILILGALTFGAYLKHKQREISQGRAMKRELNKVVEYKENMYFEAVQEILEKLADPKLKGSQKASLTRQLKDLDPEGVIRKFLEEQGERPDIAHLVNRKKATKKKNKGTLKDRPKKKKRKEEKMDFSDDEDDKVTPTPTPPSPAPAAAPKSPLDKLLLELGSSLQGTLSESSRATVLKYLRGRLEGISNEDKQQSAMGKIAARLGDEEYWVNFAANLE
jgi:hypothetical protein